MPRRAATMVLLLTAVIVLADYIVTEDAAIWLIYLLPIGLCAWYFNRWVTLSLSIAIAILCTILSPFPCPHYNSISGPKVHVILPHVCFKYITGALYHLIFYSIWGIVIGLLREQRESIARLGWESLTDELTGLYNRRYLQAKLKEEKARADRYKRPLSILMADLDHFKVYNDTNGHQKGDELLAKIGALLRRRVREIDVVCRYGGEEFLIVLPETDGPQAELVADRLRAAVADAKLGSPSSMTISIGIATYPKDAPSPELAIMEADSALYQAKSAGRNRVCCAYAGEKPQSM